MGLFDWVKQKRKGKPWNEYPPRYVKKYYSIHAPGRKALEEDCLKIFGCANKKCGKACAVRAFRRCGPLKRRKGPGWLWRGAAARLSKKWLAPLFRGFHSSLAPTARPGIYAGKPLLRKAFCGFDAHPPGGLLLSLRDNSPCVAKSDYSLRGAKPSAASGGRSEAEAQ